MVAEELDWDTHQNRLHDLVALRNEDRIIGQTVRDSAFFSRDADNFAFARFDFLHVGKAFAEYLATGSKEDAGAVFANQCNGTVFHFGSRVAFGVNLGNFFQLERTF